MEHPKAIGDRSTLAVMLALHRAGYKILVPFGENCRYDLVIDEGKALPARSVQNRPSAVRRGEILSLQYLRASPKPKVIRREYVDEIDLFGVYCPETGGVYLVPISEMSLRRQGTLRVEPSRNGQSKKIRFAATYEVANFGPET